MDELIGEEPPGLLTSLWVVDEKGTDGSLTSQDLLSDEARDVVTVPDVENNLHKYIIILTLSITWLSENLMKLTSGVNGNIINVYHKFFGNKTSEICR